MTNGIGIIKIIKHVFLPHVSRWNIHNHVETTLKIKYANEDNCGVSSHSHKNTKQTQQLDESADDEYIYVMGYESAHN